MNFKPRHFIFSTCFFFITTFSFAQNVFIANDFVACAVGLKDSSGKWIVEPIYQDIEKWSGGYFQVLYGSKEGVINSEGKVIIPPIYDYVNYDHVQIDSTVQYFFTVTEKGVSGLLNSNNQFIIPISCRKINVNDDGTIIAEKTRKRYSIYDLQGNEKVIPKKQGTEPFSLGSRMFEVSRNSFGLTLVERYFPKSKKQWRRYRYRLTLRKKYGVMNDSLRMIIPKKFSDIYYGPGKYNLITVEKRKKTGYYNTAGKQIWAPVYKIDYTFRRKNYIYGNSQTVINSFGFTAAMRDKKYGIIGANGDTILPFIYDYISMPYGANNSTSWNVDLDGKDGIYNPSERKWVVEPIYQSLSTMATFKLAGDTTNTGRRSGLYRSYYYDYNYQNGLKLLIAYKDGKYGIITSAGQEILPFVYDDYVRKFDGYCLRKDSSYYMVTVPHYSAEKTRYSYLSTEAVVSKAPADLKFKKMTAENGSTLFINLDLADDSAQLSLYQLKNEKYEMNPDTYDHLLHTVALVVTPLHSSKNMAGIGKVYTYHTPNLNYYPGQGMNDFVIRPKRTYFNIYEVNVVAKDDFHSYYSVGSASGLYRDDGFTVIRPHSYDYYSYRDKINGVAYFSINCGKNKTGLIDGNGKLLIDTAWGQIGSTNGKYAWVKKKYHPLFWSRNSYKWNILDTTTHELLLDRKLRSNDGAPFGTTAVILYRPEGTKLYNMDQRKYILDGNVRELLKLDSAGNYYAMRTCYGHIGIIDGNGKWLTDTVWKMAINANNTNQNNASQYRTRYYYREKSSYNYCVLSNDTGWIIFDGYKGIVTKDAQTIHFLLDMSSKSFTQDTIHGLDKLCDDCPSYSYADTLRNDEPLAAWQEYIMFDSLFGPSFIPDTLHYWNSYGCSDCRKRNPRQYFQYTWSGNYDQETLHHYVGFKNDSCISVSRSNLSGYSYSNVHPKDLFFTVMLFSDGPRAMLLDSLFKGTEWKTFISEETNLYFESHPNIEGNCHNPYMLPMVMKDRFVLTKDGIELYPPHYKENNHQLSVTVSWEKLKPYLREDVARKLGLK